MVRSLGTKKKMQTQKMSKNVENANCKTEVPQEDSVEYITIPIDLVLKGASPKTIAIFATIVKNGGTEQGCCLSAEKIAEIVNSSKATVHNSLNWLKEYGFLSKKEFLFGNAGRYRTVEKKFKGAKVFLDKPKNIG